MANKAESTDSHQMPSFMKLKAPERRAIILRFNGQPFEAITNHINTEFALDYKLNSVKEWFIAGGKLEVAYHEYMDAMAHQSLKEARQILMRGQRGAASALISKIKSADEKVALKAAMAVLNKYIPDKQIAFTGDVQEDDLPPELGEEGDKIIEAASADPQHRPDDEAPAGDAKDQSVS